MAKKKLTQKQQAEADAKAAGQGDMWPDFHGDQWYEAAKLPLVQISNQQLLLNTVFSPERETLTLQFPTLVFLPRKGQNSDETHSIVPRLFRIS